MDAFVLWSEIVDENQKKRQKICLKNPLIPFVF